jgi:hypothetical protein
MTLVQRTLLGLLIAAHLSLTTRLFYELMIKAWPPHVAMPVFLGVFAGQLILLGMWLSLINLPRWTRFAGAGFVATLCWAMCGILLGIKRSQVIKFDDVLSVALLGIEIVLGALTAWVVLSIGCRWLRWQISHASWTSTAPRQFHLRQAMIVIAMSCVALGLGKGIVPVMERWPAYGVQTPVLYIVSVLAIAHLGMVAAFGMNVLLTLPALALFSHKPARSWAAQGGLMLLVQTVYAGVLMNIETGIVMFMDRAKMENEFEIAGMAFAFHFVQFLTIDATLFALLGMGFKLERAPRKVSEARPEM